MMKEVFRWGGLVWSVVLKSWDDGSYGRHGTDEEGKELADDNEELIDNEKRATNNLIGTCS